MTLAARLLCAWAVLVVMAGCTATRPSAPTVKPDGLSGPVPPGFFLPRNAFGPAPAAPGGAKAPPAPAAAAPAASGTSGFFGALLSPSRLLGPIFTPRVSAVAVPPTPYQVLVYTSPTNRAFYARAQLDAGMNTLLWERLLRKYGFPSVTLNSLAELQSAPPAVLVLPSAVALSDAEKQAIADFRARGGNVLATWLTGVRDEAGGWRGFSFMETVLGVKVLGDTSQEADDVFLHVHGDSPVAHSLPAGQRVWLERPGQWYPLRLAGQHSAGQIFDWGRVATAGRPSDTLVFDERREQSGRMSRAVVFGFPERMWLTADPKALEAVAHDTLMWLLRQPAAYLSAWPHPYSSAASILVGAIEVMTPPDLQLLDLVEETGGRASYYAVSAIADKSAALLRQVGSRGHELGYLGDKYERFQGAPLPAQGQRLELMRRQMRAARLENLPGAGFAPPVDGTDETTRKLLAEHGFGHYFADMDDTEARLPFVAVPAADSALGLPLVGLPRTQRTPEELLTQGEADGLKTYLTELAASVKMGGLSVVSLPAQGLLTAEEVGDVLKPLQEERARIWIATGAQVADWWRERGRVTATLTGRADAAVLTVTVMGNQPLRHAPFVYVNLPQVGQAVRLQPVWGSRSPMPEVRPVDAWRNAVVLKGLPPGIHRWQVSYDLQRSGEAR
jgi:hypothetical protein